MDGSARILVSWLACIAALACLGAASVSFAQALYKYRDADGQLVYSDQPPPDSGKVDVEYLLQQRVDRPGVGCRKVEFLVDTETPLVPVG